jgi:hypothetical protein
LLSENRVQNKVMCTERRVFLKAVLQITISSLKGLNFFLGLLINVIDLGNISATGLTIFSFRPFKMAVYIERTKTRLAFSVI